MEAQTPGDVNPPPFKLGDRTVGVGHPCLVIAEAGVNHNGSLDLARQLIDVAVDAGADVVKFQTFQAANVVARGAPKAAYQRAHSRDTQTMYQMLKTLELDYEQFRTLKRHADERGILFMSKGHLEDIDFLVELGVPALKIDSAAIVYFSLLRKAAGVDLPVILSTGGCGLSEVERALAILAENGNPPVAVLHCTTAYPAPPDQINLRAMHTLGVSFGVHVGHSDHSIGIEVPLAAVALGARVIEKHYTLDRALPGPDHRASLEPAELAQMISGIRKIEAALGSPRKSPTSLERENLNLMRRSLIAECDVEPGERFTRDTVAFKRPGGGLGEDMLEFILGRVAVRPIAAGEPITWDAIGGFADA